MRSCVLVGVAATAKSTTCAFTFNAGDGIATDGRQEFAIVAGGFGHGGLVRRDGLLVVACREH